MLKGFVHVIGDWLYICKDSVIFQGLGYYVSSLKKKKSH